MQFKQSQRLYEIANDLAASTIGFFEKKGPGKGNRATNEYIAELGKRAIREFGQDFSEQNICGNNSLAVDFYFPEEGTIVEVALGLRNPNTEYEKDVLKAVMAKTLGYNVSSLLFISKPGGRAKCTQPGREAVKTWLEKKQEIGLINLEVINENKLVNENIDAYSLHNNILTNLNNLTFTLIIQIK